MATTEVSTAIADTLKACKRARAAIADTDPASHASQVKLQAVLDPLAAPLKALAKTLEGRHKQALQSLDRAEKTLRARSSPPGKARRPARPGVRCWRRTRRRTSPPRCAIRCWRP